MDKIVFVLGGCRSGKSAWARKYAEENFRSGIFVATAQALDDEMRQRIERHQKDRSGFWKTAEIPFQIPAFLNQAKPEAEILLVDCLTLWLSNVLCRDGYQAAQKAIEDLRDALDACLCPVILISNEVGLGIVPENALAREFRDLSGWMNQRISSAAGHVIWMIAGIAQKVK